MKFFGWDVTLGDHTGSAKLREQLRVEPIIFHLSNPDRFGLLGISNHYVEILVKSIVDRVVVAGRFDHCFCACIFLGDFIEIRVLDANLSVNLAIIIQDSDLRFVLVNVDSEVVHDWFWGDGAWSRVTPIRALRPAA